MPTQTKLSEKEVGKENGGLARKKKMANKDKMFSAGRRPRKNIWR